jgi:asparagine synthase (glutamine-hydrolysing)
VLGTSYYPDPIAFPNVTEQFVNHMLVNGFQVGVCQDVQKFDRGFAAWGVRYRSPFYDRRVIETAYSISDGLKIKGGIQKYIFRRALDGIVPPPLVNVPKYPQRMKYDLEFSNVLDELSASYLSKNKVEKRGFFQFSDIQRLIRRDTTRAYSAEGAMRVWTALMTEIWATEFLDMNGRGSEAFSATPDLEPAIGSMALA